MAHGKPNLLYMPDLPASSVVDASQPTEGEIMIEMATNIEPTSIFFLFLLVGMGVLLFAVYLIVTWRGNRRASKQPREGEIKWQRRIEAIREMERE
jgi:hypothetical protein